MKSNPIKKTFPLLIKNSNQLVLISCKKEQKQTSREDGKGNKTIVLFQPMKLKKIINKKTIPNKTSTNADDFSSEINDADDDIIVSKTYEPPQFESQLPLSNIKIKCLSDHGTIIDVCPDGN